MAPMGMKCPCILRVDVVWMGRGGRVGWFWRGIVILELMGMRVVVLRGIRGLMGLGLMGVVVG
jgi:hypothetical protein